MMKIKTLLGSLDKTSLLRPPGSAPGPEQKPAKDFPKMLDEMFKKLNTRLEKADKMAADLSAGKDIDIPAAMIAINKADISFRMFVQLRNKALNAYEEIMRLQF